MSALTTRLSLYKPGGGSTGTITPDETADIDKLNGNFDLIDAAVGATICTSGTRPATPYNGQIIFETDTLRFRTWRSTGSTWSAGATTRGALTNYLVADLTALDNVADATLGDTAWMTAPGTGINPLMWVAWAGSGSSIDWRPAATQLVVADTKAHLDTFIAAVAAIADTRFEVNAFCRALDTAFLFQFTTDVGVYKRFAGALALVPTKVGTGGTSAVDAISGEVTFSGLLTVLDVYIPTADIAMLTAAKFIDITLGYTGSVAGTMTVQFLDGAGAVNAANQYYIEYSITAASVATGIAGSVSTSFVTPSGLSRKRRRYSFRLWNLPVAQHTEIEGTVREDDLAGVNRIAGVIAGVHEVQTAFTGIRINLATGANTITLGQVTMEAHY